MQTVFTQGRESVGVERPPFGAYMRGFIPHLDYRIWPGDYLYYGIGIPMLFTVPGFLALQRRPMAWVVLATWMSVAVLFMLAGYRISMVDKQIFYMLPAMSVAGLSTPTASGSAGAGARRWWSPSSPSPLPLPSASG